MVVLILFFVLCFFLLACTFGVMRRVWSAPSFVKAVFPDRLDRMYHRGILDLFIWISEEFLKQWWRPTPRLYCWWLRNPGGDASSLAWARRLTKLNVLLNSCKCEVTTATTRTPCGCDTWASWPRVNAANFIKTQYQLKFLFIIILVLPCEIVGRLDVMAEKEVVKFSMKVRALFFVIKATVRHYIKILSSTYA